MQNPQNPQTKKQICQKMFQDLKKHLGEKVICYVSEFGKVSTASGVIKSVIDFENIQIGSNEISFIGYRCAIHKIILLNGKTLYLNDTVPFNYDFKTEEDIFHYKALQFGNIIAINKIKKTNCTSTL